MPDELPENPPPATTPSAAAAQQPTGTPAPQITPDVQAMIDARVAAEIERVRNATWKQARETLGKKNGGAPESPPAPQPAPQPNAAPQASGLTFADMVRYDAFKAAVSDHAVPAAGQSLLLERFMAAPPADVASWVADQAKAFGWQKQTPTQPAATVTPSQSGAPVAQPAPTVTPTPTPGGPPPASSAGLTRAPLHQWSQADLDAYAKANGGPAAIFRLFAQESSNQSWVMRRNR